jgi:hypothetical protein
MLRRFGTRIFTGYLFLFLSILLNSSCKKEQVHIILPEHCIEKVLYGAERLEASLSGAGYSIERQAGGTPADRGISIIITTIDDTLFQRTCEAGNIQTDRLPGKEGFVLHTLDNLVLVGGADGSGMLYGCLELAGRINDKDKIPGEMHFTDQPEMVIRGNAVGLQKPVYLPGRSVYEYPYTPETFPWFYDRDLWTRYLDMMVENRLNALFLWNGHPFASLVRLDDYPYAVEVDDSTFKQNEEIFEFLTNEAGKRGIYVIQMFYNILVSKPFAEHNGLETQDRSRPIIPLISDYTRKSVAAFIEKYPNVGLMVCLGEAINTVEDDVEWFTKTIVPGVKDGLKTLGRTDEPPIILRGHDTDPRQVIQAALPLYKNLYTTHKYNGESLTTYQPRGSWAEIHQDLSKLGSVHIANVHILANLEPFRYGSPDFIRKSVLAMHNIQGANGLHLYPQASYWDWPWSADKAEPRLFEMERDWIWYRAWARYAWQSNRDSTEENTWWSEQLGDYYGCGKNGRFILEAYEETGEIAPKLLRRFGISDGNRQTLLLGMFMSQLVNPYKWRVYSNFYTSNGPEGEILLEYAEKEWKGQSHTGETPPRVIREVTGHAEAAVTAIEKASSHVRLNMDEFSRLQNDVYCYHALAHFFAEKVEAAMLVLRFKYSNDIADLEKAVPHLEKSVGYYEELTRLTADHYLYANSMQTRQRRIPIGGDEGKNKTWTELLPCYKEELDKFRNNIEWLIQSGEGATARKSIQPWIPAGVEFPDGKIELYPIKKGERVFTDRESVIDSLAPELKDLTGIRFSREEQVSEGTKIRFINDAPVKVVVGYFNGHSWSILPSPALETDANANDRGQADIKLANAIDIPGLYPVNIYTYYYEPGENILELDKGMVLILGFMDGSQELIVRDAELTKSENIEGIDWLFY